MSRRRGNVGSLVVIYWRDIPAQVTAGGRSDGHKVLLPARFQHAIDRAAVVAGTTDTASYVAEWRRVTESLGNADPEATAIARAEALDATYAAERLDALVASGGWSPTGGRTDQPTPTEGSTP